MRGWTIGCSDVRLSIRLIEATPQGGVTKLDQLCVEFEEKFTIAVWETSGNWAESGRYIAELMDRCGALIAGLNHGHLPEPQEYQQVLHFLKSMLPTVFSRLTVTGNQEAVAVNAAMDSAIANEIRTTETGRFPVAHVSFEDIPG